MDLLKDLLDLLDINKVRLSKTFLFIFLTFFKKTGETEVIVSVNGPTQAPQKKQIFDKMCIELYIFEKDETLHDTDNQSSKSYKAAERNILKLLESCIHTLELPGTLLTICILVVQDSGSVWFFFYKCIIFVYLLNLL